METIPYALHSGTSRSRNRDKSLKRRSKMLEALTVKKAVEFAITTEQQGSRIYRKLARRYADNKELVDLFELLADEEDKHEQALVKLRERVSDQEVSSGDESFQYLRAMSISEFFSGADKLFSRDNVGSAEDALSRAMGLEKATLSFYEAMRDVLDEHNDVLDGLIKAEKRHVLFLMRYMITDERIKGLPSGKL